ncbi:PH and SEC7 domain-containing protein 1 [Spea bombifrons]|uniref:PH and SEC7 domain-containing protein 1 n=1 Tax=Spea bombifrons TaxID=233779 RepID=UPI00234AD278|nr:PH and SEC7 domain-containing protein 1 [Spea bombifrons]
MVETSGVVHFQIEGDCLLSSPRSFEEFDGKPWLPALKPEITNSAQHCYTPNLNSQRIQVLRKSLMPEARRAHLGMYNSTGSLVCQPSDIGHRSGRATAPCSPLRNKQNDLLYSPGSRIPLVFSQPLGQSSIVTFTFVKKSSVQNLNGFHSSDFKQKDNGDQHEESSINVKQELGSCHGKEDILPEALCISEQVVGSPILETLSSQSARSKLFCNRESNCESKSPCCADFADGLTFESSNGYINTKNLTSIVTSSKKNPSNNSSHLLKRFVGEAFKLKEQVDARGFQKEASLHAQKIAKAKWEFFYGSPKQNAGVQLGETLTCPCSPTNTDSFRNATLEPVTDTSRLGLCHVEVEIETTHSTNEIKSENCETGIIRRTIKYSETDIDSVPLRCYRETNIDDILAENEGLDSAIGSQKDSESNRSVTDTSLRKENEQQKEPQEEDILGFQDNRDDDEDEVFETTRKDESKRDNIQKPCRSSLSFLLCHRLSEDEMDSFSKHFESIMESHRAKGTSYSSLDSIDILSYSTQNQNSFFTFELPTLTPETQKQICKNAQINEDNFAPLAHLELDSSTSSTKNSVCSEHEEDIANVAIATNALASPSPSEDSLNIADDIIQSEPPLGNLASESNSKMDSTECLAHGSTDTLSNGHKADQEAAKRLAKRLYNLDGFRKADVARHLGKNNEFSKMVAEEYLKFFVFTGMSLDQALRMFLKELALMGETQERERILAHFSQRYHQCNANSITSEDGVHTLTCALMLLNTDLHGHNIGKRMSCSEFIGNLEGLNAGKDFPRELLKALYSSIKNEKLQWTIDEEELRRSLSELADPNPKSIKRIDSCGKPFLDFSQDPNITTYKYGGLVRKIHADPDCKKTPRGKRGWKTFHGILKGMILYLQKEEYKPGKPLSEEDLKNAISIHHSLATRASDYNKRPNVFYLRTADWRVFLFQAQNSEQMHSWITRINVVAAMFSAPPFPAAIGSHKKFSRPLLPSTVTRLSQEDQMKTHESKFKSMSSSLIEHRTSPPDKKLKGKEVDEFKQKEEYLEFEKSRYGTYAMLLRTKLKAGTEDLEAFDTTLFESTENDEDGLKKSCSSPLNFDPPTTSTKVKYQVFSQSSCRPDQSSRQKS